MDDEALEELIETVISGYLGDLKDPGEVDSVDLAENIASYLRRHGAIK